MTIDGAVAGTPAMLRSINDRAALAILLAGQPMSRNQLSKRAEVSKPTASQMVRRLEKAGFVEVTGMTSGGRGPNTALYGVRTDRILGVALDVRSDVVLSTVVDAIGTDHRRATTSRRPGAGAVEEVREAVRAACAAAAADIAAVVAVSIGLQASVATRTDQLILPNSLAGWPQQGARAMLEAETGWGVTLANDVNLAASAERSSGSGRGTESFALLWIGHGLGFAADVGGRPLIGSRGAAGEIGVLHVSGGPSAGGEPRTLDDLFEPEAVAALAAQHGLPSSATSTESLVAALAGGSSRGGAFLAALAPRVAAAMPAVVAILDPEAIILGGPLGAAGGVQLARLVADEAAAAGTPAPLILSAAVRADPVLVGARETLSDHIRTRLLDEAATLTTP